MQFFICFWFHHRFVAFGVFVSFSLYFFLSLSHRIHMSTVCHHCLVFLQLLSNSRTINNTNIIDKTTENPNTLPHYWVYEAISLLFNSWPISLFIAFSMCSSVQCTFSRHRSFYFIWFIDKYFFLKSVKQPRDWLRIFKKIDQLDYWLHISHKWNCFSIR